VDSKQVIEMLDAIFEGREWEIEIKPGDRLMLDKDGITFSPRIDTLFEIDNPSIARQIAGALVSWANKVDDTAPLTGPEVMATMKLFDWATPRIEHHSVNKTRTEWYHRNVQIMTPKTMMRHFRDLKVLEKCYSREGNDIQLMDVGNSIDILWKAMRETDAFDMNPRAATVNWKAEK
jgi:hypothetical protein